MSPARGRASRARVWVLVVAGCLLCARAWPIHAADLGEPASRAYAEYFANARRAFVNRATQGSVDSVAGDDAALRAGRLMVRSGGGDGILDVPGGLVHHWHGEVFIPGVTLDQVVEVSHSYADYPKIFHPVASASVLSEDDTGLRVQFRMRASAGGMSATLDVRTHVQYVRVDARRAYVVSLSDEIREVKDAGRPTERALPAGHDNGYLWRAGALTAFVAGKDGVFMTMETVGLSRPFPPLLGWIVEPIARRVGRRSVEDSMQEFRSAMLARSR
jgi:hypothetical protein